MRGLLHAGADSNARPSWKTSAIVEAVRKGNLPIQKRLLGQGPDVNAKASDDGTALYQAMCKGKTDRVKLL